MSSAVRPGILQSTWQHPAHCCSELYGPRLSVCCQHTKVVRCNKAARYHQPHQRFNNSHWLHIITAAAHPQYSGHPGALLPTQGQASTTLVSAVSWATWLQFTGVLAQCVVLGLRCPGPLGSSSPLCSLGALCRVCGVLALLALFHRCARSACCVACAVSCATWHLFTVVHARCVVLHVRCPGLLGSCSPVWSFGLLCCVCGVLGHLAPVHGCVCSACCVACAVSSASWPRFTGAHAQCVVLRVRCPGPRGSC